MYLTGIVISDGTDSPSFSDLNKNASIHIAVAITLYDLNTQELFSPSQAYENTVFHAPVFSREHCLPTINKSTHKTRLQVVE